MILKTKFYKKSRFCRFCPILWDMAIFSIENSFLAKKLIKRPYLRKYGKSEKSKATLFSQTLWWKLIFGQKKCIKRPYLKKYGKSGKSKTTLFSQTFKVWENKVPLVLSILPYFLRYGHFKIFSIFLLLGVQNHNSFHGKLTIPFSNIIIFSYFWVSLLSWKIISF